METFSVVYLPIGVGTFDMESARKQFLASWEMLCNLNSNIICPNGILLTPSDLSTFLENKSPDLVIIQNITFANASYTAEVISSTNCPILLWTLREPQGDGGRLRLNSLTGAFSAAHTIRNAGRASFEYVYGDADEAKDKIVAVIRAAKIRYSLKHLKLAQIGHTPQGFGFGRASDEDMLQYFGVHLESIETRQLIAKANTYSLDEISNELYDAHKIIRGLNDIPQKNVEDFARLWKAYKTFIEEEKIGAVASRCWPDFFTEYGTPVCAVLAMLNENGIAASCEADSYGALSMYVGMKLSEKPAFFGDPVAVHEESASITFWHCGTAACSLAREDTGPCAGIHCNRKVGPTLDFGCKASNTATIFRIGKREDGGFRLFVLKGRILDVPKQFIGTSMVVQIDGDVRRILEHSIKDGWEPHFVVAYGDISDELKIFASMMQLDLYCYRD